MHAQFTAVTGASDQQAAQFLELTGHNYELAVELYFTSGAGALAPDLPQEPELWTGGGSAGVTVTSQQAPPDGPVVVVEGLDGVMGAVQSEMTTIAALGYRAMAGSGWWAAADASSVSALDRSGGGGSKTYRLDCRHAGVWPRTVALHARNQHAAADLFVEAKNAAATAAFSEAGCGPRRLAQGHDWYVEVWDGEVIGHTAVEEG